MSFTILYHYSTCNKCFVLFFARSCRVPGCERDCDSRVWLPGNLSGALWFQRVRIQSSSGRHGHTVGHCAQWYRVHLLQRESQDKLEKVGKSRKRLDLFFLLNASFIQNAQHLLFMCFHSLVVAEMQAASALISIGAVLGKSNLVHLILIALLEVSGFVLNGRLLETLLQVQLHH